MLNKKQLEEMLVSAEETANQIIYNMRPGQGQDYFNFLVAYNYSRGYYKAIYDLINNPDVASLKQIEEVVSKVPYSKIIPSINAEDGSKISYLYISPEQFAEEQCKLAFKHGYYNARLFVEKSDSQVADIF